MKLQTHTKLQILKELPAKRCLAVVVALCLVGSIWLTCHLTRASQADYSLTGGNVVLDGANDGSVMVALKTSKARTYVAIQGTWSIHEVVNAGAAQTQYFTLNATGGRRGGTINITYGDNGIGIWTPEDGVGMPVAANGEVLSAVYTVDKDTPAGTYKITLSGGLFTYYEDDDVDEPDTIAAEATVTVTRSDSTPDPDPDPGTDTQTFTLTYNANQGAFPTGAATTQSCTTATESPDECDITLSLPEPTRENYSLLGWAEESTASTANTNYVADNTITLTSHSTIYAIWATDETTPSDPDDEGDSGTTPSDPGDEGDSETTPSDQGDEGDSGTTPDSGTDSETDGSSTPASGGGTITPNTGMFTNDEGGVSAGGLVLFVGAGAALALVFLMSFGRKYKVVKKSSINGKISFE